MTDEPHLGHVRGLAELRRNGPKISLRLDMLRCCLVKLYAGFRESISD
jgi:hypothetical protein